MRALAVEAFSQRHQQWMPRLDLWVVEVSLSPRHPPAARPEPEKEQVSVCGTCKARCPRCVRDERSQKRNYTRGLNRLRRALEPSIRAGDIIVIYRGGPTIEYAVPDAPAAAAGDQGEKP